MTNKRLSLFFVSCVLCLVSHSPSIVKAESGTQMNLDSIKSIPILENGRVKPLDTYAKNILLQFSGRDSINRRPASEWLAKLLWEPEKTFDDKVLLINNPEIPLALGVLPDPHRRYSFSQLEKGFHKLEELAKASAQIEDKQRSIVEKELMRVYENVYLYLDLSHSFQFASPHEDFTINEPQIYKKLNIPEGQSPLSFLDVTMKADVLQEITAGMDKKDSQNWTPVEKEVFRLLSNMYQWSMYYKNLPFAIIAPVQEDEHTWISPSDALAEHFQKPFIKDEILALKDLRDFYLEGSQETFDEAAWNFRQSISARAPHIRAVKYLLFEVFYNNVRPFLWAKIFYFIALGLVIWFLIANKAYLQSLSFFLISLGLLIHTFGLVSRIIIMGRPPVTNLYETFIFVSWVAGVLGILTEFIQRRGLGVLVTSFCGFVLLLIAGKFATDGDTMRVLIAVLNSNFWLNTHVLTITMGYGGCCVAGVIGHVYLLQSMRRGTKDEGRETTYQFLIGALAFGLTLSFLGTTLGGIWADQSWGRFWGWDPKENGAMMIVLWCAIIFHAKVAKMIGPVGVAIGSILGLIVVMWTWFGVNLLSVGLHSYGFTSGVATNLLIYVIAELAFLIFTFFYLEYQTNRRN